MACLLTLKGTLGTYRIRYMTEKDIEAGAALIHSVHWRNQDTPLHLELYVKKWPLVRSLNTSVHKFLCLF